MKAALHEFSERKTFFLLVLMEIIFAIVMIVSLLNMLGFSVFQVFEQGKYSFSFNPNLLDVSFFVFGLVLLLLVFFAIKKRFPMLYSVQQDAWSEVRISAGQKIHNARTDSRAVALLIIEMMFVIVVFVSISAFFDQNFELIPWSNAGIFPPETTVINALIAVLVLAGFYWLYSQTADYRQERKILKAKTHSRK